MLTSEDIKQLRRLMELRQKRDETKTASATAESEFREAEAELFERLTDPETGAIGRIPPIDLGEPWGRVAFQSRETPYGKIIKGKEAEAEQWLRDNGLIDEYTELKPAKKRVNELVRERLDNGAKLPPGFDFYHNRGVTITRQKGS